MRCVCSPSFSILINGEVKGFFKGERGIRQGDPLSLFLFTCAMHVLSLLIDKAAVHHGISGFQASSQGTKITHLQFADGTIFFLDADTFQVKTLQDILLAFELCSGLHVNFAKSTVFPIQCQEEAAHLSSVLNCQVGKLPSTYLGLPLSMRSYSKGLWTPVLDRVQKR